MRENQNATLSFYDFRIKRNRYKKTPLKKQLLKNFAFYSLLSHLL